MLNTKYQSNGEEGSRKPPPFLRVSFKGHRREVFRNAAATGIMPGEYVIVESENGLDLGMVSPICNNHTGCGQGPCAETVEADPRQKGEPRKLLRKATAEEISHHFENRRQEESAVGTALDLIQRNRLDMKLVDVEYQLDRKKMTFFYTAEERVDFRQLVKDLAHVFRTRIEMRQIGVRDYARRLGGVGPCGQELCCSRFMEGFEPVTTQYAKDQNLPINPSKLSGACGKLKCCLRFEWDFYKESQKEFPDIGLPVELKTGVGSISGHDLLNRRVTVTFENGTLEIHSLKDIKRVLQRMESRSKKRKTS